MLKVIVNQNILILLSFTHPYIVPNLYEFLQLDTQADIWRMSVTKQ